MATDDEDLTLEQRSEGRGWFRFPRPVWMLVAFGAGAAVALVSFFSRIFAQVRGGVAGMAPRGRKPTAEESMRLEGQLPGLKMNGWTVTGGPTPIGFPGAYNCFGWGLCSRAFGWQQPTPGIAPKKQLAELDKGYATVGFKVAMDCKPRKGFRKVAIYCNKAGAPTHATKQIEGDWWESKLGMSERIVHRGTAALEGMVYGAVCRCYEIGLKEQLKQTQNQLKAIQNALMTGANGDLKTAEKEAKEQISAIEKAIKVELP